MDRRPNKRFTIHWRKGTIVWQLLKGNKKDEYVYPGYTLEEFRYWAEKSGVELAHNGNGVATYNYFRANKIERDGFLAIDDYKKSLEQPELMRRLNETSRLEFLDDWNLWLGDTFLSTPSDIKSMEWPKVRAILAQPLLPGLELGV
jgi:hypothetical protein